MIFYQLHLVSNEMYKSKKNGNYIPVVHGINEEKHL